MPRVPEQRRQPARASKVVDSVIDAAHELLAEEGESLSTNKVAARAGVSVGSLYHYFPTKEAIVAELARRLETRGLEMALERFARGASWPVADLVRELVAILVSPDIGVFAARRTILRSVPAKWFEAASTAADREVRAWALALIEARRAELRQGPPDIMAFVAFHAVEGVVEAAIVDRPERASDPVFFEDLVTLMASYVSSTANAEDRELEAGRDVTPRADRE
jgi:AcrR family transcriptional regulator